MIKSLLLSATAAFALLLAPVAAGAHTRLVGSTPAANSTVSKVTSVNLQFNEKIVASTLKAELVMTGMPGMAALIAMGRPGLSVISNLVAGLGLLPLLPLFTRFAGLEGAGYHAFLQAIIVVGLLGSALWRITARSDSQV